MSHILDHARAMRVLGEALIAQGEQAGLDLDDATDRLLTNMGRAHIAASDRLIGEAAADARAWAASARCTIDHTTIKAPKCPACGANRG